VTQGRLRPVRIAGAMRNRLGTSGRRGYREWAAMPERPDPASAWWARDPHWFPAGAPPRNDTRVAVLIDGEETFRAAWDAIRNAKYSVWLVDWAMSTNMALVRGADTATVPPAHGPDGDGYKVHDLLTDVANRVDVRVLVWSGSLIFRPYAFVARRELKRLRRGNPRVQGQVDKHIRFSHCHHQKTIVVDGRIAFVGGLDMTDFDVDRWDTTQHPVRAGLNWHDLCLRLEGEAAADVARNFTERWQAVTGEALQVPAPAPQTPSPGAVPVQIVRTIPAGLYPFAPRGEFGIAWAYQQGIRHARQFIYLENQYLWSPAVVNELIAALQRVKDPAFRIVLVLPARPNIGKNDTDVHVQRLREADAGQGRVHFFSLYTAGPDKKRSWIYKPIYVHAKVAVIDDAWCTVGSANLNQRGLEGDSEINVQIPDGALARELRLRLWSEHLGLPRETIATLSPSMAIDLLWVPLADHARNVIDGRGGVLRTAVVHYQDGSMPGDLSLGELEARLLDA
jgi:phosphatidylserine/phosphatidylglycerophosphate/cardiolipin synthase-like enzyme